MPRGNGEKRAERLLHLVSILNSGDGFSGTQLAEKLNVSLRTVYRDVVALSTLVPIYYDGGYRLLADASIQKLAFTRSELAALLLSARIRPAGAAAYLAPAATAAVAKLTEDFLRRFGEHAQGDFPSLTKAGGEDNTPVPAVHIRALEEAIDAGGRLEIRFFHLGQFCGGIHVVDPYGLMNYGQRRYVLGYCHSCKSEFLSSVARIDILRTLPPASVMRESGALGFPGPPPGGGEPAAREVVRIRFARHLFPGIKKMLSDWGDFTVGRDGGPVIFEGKLPITNELYWWFIKFGGDAEILQPQELRNMIATFVKAAAAVYSRD